MKLFDWFKSRKLEERPEPQPHEFLEPVDTDPELAALSPDDQDRLAHYLIEADWVHVSSTNVEAMKYNIQDHTMDVEFQHGRYYQYQAVGVQYFLDFLKADSPGGWIWEQVRRPDKFNYVRYGFGGTRPIGDKNIKVL